MEVEIGFTKVVCGQKVVEHAYNIVGSFSSVDYLVNKIVNLYLYATLKLKIMLSN